MFANLPRRRNGNFTSPAWAARGSGSDRRPGKTGSTCSAGPLTGWVTTGNSPIACVRRRSGPSEAAWQAINAHLGTEAHSLSELVNELGRKRFGHTPRVGDAFCGGGSVPFEAAVLGCDVYGADLNPVGTLLTWAAIHLIGGGAKTATEIK